LALRKACATLGAPEALPSAGRAWPVTQATDVPDPPLTRQGWALRLSAARP